MTAHDKSVSGSVVAAAPSDRDTAQIVMLKAVALLNSYAEIIRLCPAAEIERFDYLPEVEDAAQHLRMVAERLPATRPTAGGADMNKTCSHGRPWEYPCRECDDYTRPTTSAGGAEPVATGLCKKCGGDLYHFSWCEFAKQSSAVNPVVRLWERAYNPPAVQPASAGGDSGERDAFEAWWKDRPRGIYTDQDYARLAWQARAAHQAPQAGPAWSLCKCPRCGQEFPFDKDYVVAGAAPQSDNDPTEGCPNCVSEWKCNGPHVPNLYPSGTDAAPQAEQWKCPVFEVNTCQTKPCSCWSAAPQSGQAPQAASVPGLKCGHQIITLQCRFNRGPQGAFTEAVERLRSMYDSILPAPANEDATYHLILTVERDAEAEAPAAPQSGGKDADALLREARDALVSLRYNPYPATGLLARLDAYLGQSKTGEGD